jgi:hypothetical protein
VTIDVTGVEQRLDQVYAALIGTSGDPTDIRAAIWNLAGPAPGASLADLLTAIQAGNAEWDSGAGITAYNLLDALRSEAVTRNNLLSAIDAEWDSGAGITPYNLLDALRSSSISIQNCICDIASGPTGPPTSGTNACSGTNLTSTGMIPDTISSELRNTVTFPNELPAQLQFAIDYALEPASGYTWDGIQVWVTSSANTFTATDPLTIPHPTNTWVDLSDYGTIPLLFSVPDGDTIEVTLCVPGAGTGVGDCIELQSQISTSNGYTFSAIVWPDTWNAVVNYQTFQGGSTRWILIGDYQNWTYTILGSPGLILVREESRGDISTTDEGNGYRRINQFTETLTIATAGGTTPPFSIILCPPGVNNS